MSSARRRPAALILLAVMAASRAGAAGPEEIVVTATRFPEGALAVAGNTARLDGDRIGLLNPGHIHELGTQVPGTWLSRGSGQEHLTAIRSPVLTGPGSCGSFLFLEDGVPIRPTGFCNVNELFEVASEQATALEVIRGPANALYGSNAVHGTLNVLLPAPGDEPGFGISAETGPNRFLRGQVLVGTGDSVLGILADRDDGFRDESDYRQAKVFGKHRLDLPGGELELAFTVTILDQETAGFVLGENAYKDKSLRTTNANPESYRDANAQRFQARYRPVANGAERGWEAVAFLRRSDMDFLQHFLPGQPVEENGQLSGGTTVTAYRRWTSGLALTSGLDLEVAEGFLKETQTSPETGNPARPAGRHYDYEVRQYLAAPYAQLRYPLAPRWELTAGLRLEYLLYDYDNRMLAGNTREDGTPCGGSGCLFNRPADRNDDFLNLVPNAGLLFRVNEHSAAWVSLTRGFRAPQAAELYRLQAGQNAADLDSESLDSLELGWRWQADGLKAEAVAFAMEKKNYILQDSNRFNVSNGESRHLGVELNLAARSDSGLYAELAGTWARQTYAFDRVIAGGETITDGNDIDTAPRTLGSLRAGYDAGPWLAEAEWVHQGRYYLTAEESVDYDGHEILNLRGLWRAGDHWTVTLRVNNVLDELYADRADYAFGDYRYFPGRDREAFLEIAYRSRPR
jgi:iron complex outermembrane receptor protein